MDRLYSLFNLTFLELNWRSLLRSVRIQVNPLLSQTITWSRVTWLGHHVIGNRGVSFLIISSLILQLCQVLFPTSKYWHCHMSWTMIFSQSRPSSVSRDSRYESCDLGIKLDTMHLIVYLPDKNSRTHTRHDDSSLQSDRAMRVMPSFFYQITIC